MKILAMLFGVGWLAVWMLAGSAAGESESKPVVSRTYKLSMVSSITMTSDQDSRKSEADTVLSFTVARNGQTESYTCKALFSRVKLDGRELQYADMAADKYATKDDNGSLTETDLTKASAELKEMLKDYFATPLATITFDAVGKESGCTVSEKPNLKPLLQNGMLANMRLFLSAYDEKARTWREEKEFGLGKGGFVKGALALTKGEAGKDSKHSGRVDVQMSGVLTADGYKTPNGNTTVRNAKYEIAGMQTWDATLKCWIVGDLGMRVSYDVYEGENKLFTANGNMIAKLELTAPKP